MKNKLSGLGVAMITPFQTDGKIDYKGLEKLTNYLIQGEVDYLVVQGTTGENVTLSEEEKQDVLQFVVEVNKGRKPIVYGVGGNNTASIVKKLSTLNTAGVDAILSVSPYYNKPSQEGIFQHFQAVCEASPLPVILYNVPGRTGSNMQVSTTIRIAQNCPNAVAIKEASGDVMQIMQVVREAPESFLVISGDDGITLPLLATGCHGVISVIGNAFPREFSSLVRHALNGDFSKALPIHHRLFDLYSALFTEGNPAGVKEVLHFLNICSNHTRLPLVPVSEKHSQFLYKILAEQGLN